MTWFCHSFCFQDIRKFFSGAAATQNKPKETSSRQPAEDTSAKTVVKVVDKKPEKSTQPKTKAAPKTASAGSDDIYVIDSESESEDFSCKKSKNNLNNNDVKANKRSKSTSSVNKESSSTASVSHQQHNTEVEKQHSSVSKDKASDSAGRRSRSKGVKDEAAGSSSKSTAALKPDDVCQRLMLFFVPIFG